jgi:hypothetical protein
MERFMKWLLPVAPMVALMAPAGAIAGYAMPGVYEPPANFFAGTPKLVNFDTDASGVAIPAWTDIREQYAAWGVTFSLATGSPAGSTLKAGTWGQDFISAPRALTATFDGYSDNTGLTIVINLSDDHASFPTAAGLVFTDSGPNNPFTLTAFDASGAAADSVTIDTADGSWNSTDHAEDTFCGVQCLGGISRLEYSTRYLSASGIRGLEVDNLYFGYAPASGFGLLTTTTAGEVVVMCEGGNAAASSVFGWGARGSGTHQTLFDDVPHSCPAETSLGTLPAGTQLHFWLQTGSTVVYSSDLSDANVPAVALEVFTDRNNSLPWGGLCVEPLGTDDWRLHLDDALSGDDDDNDVAVRVRVMPPRSDQLTISGVVTYKSQQGAKEPAAHVWVEAWEAIGSGSQAGYPVEKIAEGATGADGRFSFTKDTANEDILNVDSAPAGDGGTRDICIIVRPINSTVRVLHNDYMFSTLFDVTPDVFPADPFRPFHIASTAGTPNHAEVFGIPGYLKRVQDRLDAAVHWTRETVSLEYPAGGDRSSYNWPDDTIYLRESRSSMVHEYGHAVHAKTLLIGWLPGWPDWRQHGSCTESNPGFALTEGWAEFFQASFGEGTPDPAFEDGGTPPFWMGCDVQYPEGTYINTPTNTGEKVEGAVTCVFWDLYDGANDDGVDSKFSKLWAVFLNRPESLWAASPADPPKDFYHAYAKQLAMGAGDRRAFDEIFLDQGIPVTDDAYESHDGNENDNIAHAYPLGVLESEHACPDLIVTDPDWYKFTIAAPGGAVEITVEFQKARGQLELYWCQSANGDQTINLVQQGHEEVAAQGWNRLLAGASVAAGEYYVLVVGAGDQMDANFNSGGTYEGDYSPHCKLIINPTGTQLQAPKIISITPDSTPAGGPSFHLHAYGENFVQGSELQWNGSPRVTNFLSATHLTGWILDTDIAAAGSAAVNVQNGGETGPKSNSVPFSITEVAPGAPSITSIDPASRQAGLPAFDLQVYGESFDQSSQVQWNGQARATSYGSATHLTASILASDIAVSGTAGIVVRNGGGSGPMSNEVTFTITSAGDDGNDDDGEGGGTDGGCGGGGGACAAPPFTLLLLIYLRLVRPRIRRSQRA